MHGSPYYDIHIGVSLKGGRERERKRCLLGGGGEGGNGRTRMYESRRASRMYVYMVNCIHGDVSLV